MRPSSPLLRTLLFLFTVTLSPAAALAADDTYEQEYEERARVLRVTLVKGEASLLRAGNDEWESVRLNLPLVEGDRLATGRDSRLEIQVDARNFVRLGPDSTLRVATLRDEGIAFSITEGTATFRLARFDRDREYFEVDAPKSTLAAEKAGLYRVDVGADGEVGFTVRDEARARIYSESSGFVLRNNRAARLTRYGADDADWELSSAPSFDEWDSWNDDRERYLASRLRFDGRERYYDPEVWGAEELDQYGDWVHTREYGYVWRPRVTVINNYNNWAPYRYGHWRWCPPYGWTWIPDEDWGWAPYHYGRWVYVNNYWCWAPRGYGYRYRRARWRPALVAFVTIDFGNDRHVCWYPLTYGQRDPRGRWWSRRYEPLTPLRGREIEHLRRANPALLRAVTTVPARDFGAAALRARPAAGDLAQRALASEPVRGQLPVVRADASRGAARAGTTAGGARPTGENGREVLTINRPAPVMPPRVLPDRPTGAAARTPGVPLDGELRRTRVFNNREPRVATPSTPGGDSQGSGSLGGDTGTGAVERPRVSGSTPSNPGGDSRPVRARPTRPSTPVDPSPGRPDESAPLPERRRDADDDLAPRRVRPTRPPFEQPPAERPRDDGSNNPPVYRTEPRVRPRDEGERPAPPPRREEPQPRREEPPSYRPERSAPRESPPPRSEPPPREAPPPREESPRHESPRPEPRQEQPRPDPPRPDPPRQEAPRQESPREDRPDPPPRVRERP